MWYSNQNCPFSWGGGAHIKSSDIAGCPIVLA